MNQAQRDRSRFLVRAACLLGACLLGAGCAPSVEVVLARRANPDGTLEPLGASLSAEVRVYELGGAATCATIEPLALRVAAGDRVEGGTLVYAADFRSDVADPAGPPIGSLDGERHAVVAILRDADCVVTLFGCTEHASSDASGRVVVDLVPVARATPGDCGCRTCSAGRCEGSASECAP